MPDPINITINIYNCWKPVALTCELSLTNSPLKTIVDAKYYSELCKHKISLTWGYPQMSILGIKYRLHKWIMIQEGKVREKLEVDHIDRNKLNNTAANLRMVTRQENNRNIGKRESGSSKYIGVSRNKNGKKWRAQIMHNYKKIYLGSYEDEEVAARAYDEALANIPLNEACKQYNFPR